MLIDLIPGALKRLRQRAGPLQRTFQTALDRLPAFSACILEGEPLRTGSVTIEAVVFPPRNLTALLAAHSLTVAYEPGITIVADGPQECMSLLTAALGDWLDFYFLPDPKRFLLYADHDEYATVFAGRKGPLSRIGTAMAQRGFSEIEGYVRSLQLGSR